MQSIKGFSSRQINLLLGTKKSIWQIGFYDYILDNEEKTITRMNYIETNPVRMGIVSDPKEYSYSSARYRENTDYKEKINE